MEFGRDHCENVFRNPICNASLAFADGQEARMVTSQDTRFVVVVHDDKKILFRVNSCTHLFFGVFFWFL